MASQVCEFRDLLLALSSLLYRRNPCTTADQAASLISLVARVINDTGTRNFEKDIPALLRISEELVQQGQVSKLLGDALEKLLLALSHKDHWEGADRRRPRMASNTCSGCWRLHRSATSRGSGNAIHPKSTLRMFGLSQSPSFCRGWTTRQVVPGMICWRSRARRTVLNRPKSGSRRQRNSPKRSARMLSASKFWNGFSRVRPTDRASTFLGIAGPPINESNADLLKGIVWCCGNLDDAETIHAFSNLAQTCFKKIPGVGPLSAKVGNACLCILSQLPGLEPVAQLSRLRMKVKYAVALRMIDRALQEAAEKLGMSTEELEEIAVPTYGFDDTGTLREEFGEFTAELKITGTDSTKLRWLKADGTPQKTVPAAVKETCAEDWKEFKRTVQDIEKMLPAQRDRIERLLVSEREMEFDKWLERYHQHPLISGLSRRLIWRFQLDGKLCSRVVATASWWTWRTGRWQD